MLFPALSTNARLSAAVVAALSTISVGLRVIYDMSAPEAEPLAVLWDLARFFTILTHVVLTVTFALLALRRDGVYPPWIAAVTLSIAMVGGVYHTLLAHLVNFNGVAYVADVGLHTVVPVACVLWWLWYAPKRRLSYEDIPLFALWPSTYVAYALGRGTRDGIYPYPFMDLTTLSKGAVASNILGLVLVFLLGGVVMILIGRYADR